MGVVVTGAATTFGNGIGQNIFSDVTAPTGQPVIIESAQYVAPFRNSFVFPQQLSSAQVAAFTIGQEDFQTYMNRIAVYGGVPIGGAVVGVVLFGKAKQTTVISKIVIQPRCTTPPSGTLIFFGSAGLTPSAQLGFNLDNPFPVAQNVKTFHGAFDGLYGNYFQDGAITVSPGETQTLSIYALTNQRYCTFTYKLLVDTPGGSVTETVTNHGRPFAVSGGLPRNDCYRAEYAGGIMSSSPDEFTRVSKENCRIVASSQGHG